MVELNANLMMSLNLMMQFVNDNNFEERKDNGDELLEQHLLRETAGYETVGAR